MKKLTYTLVLPLFIFCLLPLAQAQESTMSKEMTEVIEKAVEKSVNERIAAIKADLVKEIATQAQNYCIAQIDAYYPESQTASIITKRRVVDGKIINKSYACGGIPIFIPAGANTIIRKGDPCIVFFSAFSRYDNYELITDRSDKNTADAFAIVGFFETPTQERRAKEEAMIAALTAHYAAGISGNAQATSRSDTRELCSIINRLITELKYNGYMGNWTLSVIQDDLEKLADK